MARKRTKRTSSGSRLLTRDEAVALTAAQGLTHVRVPGQAKTSAETVIDALAALGLLRLRAAPAAPAAPVAPPALLPPPHLLSRRWHWLLVPQQTGGAARSVAEFNGSGWALPGVPGLRTPEQLAAAGCAYDGAMEEAD